ncbi:hypothetical protein SSX86_005147 [Deinandra increscens subsp. villosa]|uniref:OTU domain-containing protein n=1 Tax=Deinandra increscens subsp. villosa TaxID=3103831 RepID=A0AAP0H6L4_9ASTR
MSKRHDNKMTDNQYHSQPTPKASKWILQKWRPPRRTGEESSNRREEVEDVENKSNPPRWIFPNRNSDRWSENVHTFYNNGDVPFCYSKFLGNTKLDGRFWGALLGYEENGELTANVYYVIPIEEIDTFWRHLDYRKPACADEGVDIDYDAAFEEMKEDLKSKPRHMQSNIFEKLRSVFNRGNSNPKMKEPEVKKDTRGRPSNKVKEQRAQEHARHSSYTGTRENVPEQPRYSSYTGSQQNVDPDRSSEFVTPGAPNTQSSQRKSKKKEKKTAVPPNISTNNYIRYKAQIPRWLDPIYISRIQNVDGDGNCGFRALAVGLGLQQSRWPYVRSELLNELQTNEVWRRVLQSQDSQIFMFTLCNSIFKLPNRLIFIASKAVTVPIYHQSSTTLPATTTAFKPPSLSLLSVCNEDPHITTMASTDTTNFDLTSNFGASSEYTFADVGNLDHCTKYLNQTLVTFGFPASLDLFATDPVSIARTCNCMYSLLQQRQRDIEFRESTNDQRQRLSSDISRLEAKVERLESQLSAKDREIATITRTEAKAKAGLKAQIEKLQQERDEYQKMVIGNQQVRTQQIHEMKKKEKEYIKLQERLNQVMMEKKKESRSGMEIMNLLQKEGRQRGTWNGKKADNDFYKKIVDAYEAKNQELVTENSDLRALLRSMQVDMRDFLNAPNGSSKHPSPVNERDVDPSQSPLGGRTDVFDLPFHMGRDQIEAFLRNKVASIKERMGQLQDAQKEAEVTSEATERELELEAQLVEARSIIQEQASIMSKHIAKSEKPRRLSGHLNSVRDSSTAEVNICFHFYNSSADI